MKFPSLGLWVDDPSSMVATPQYWDSIVDIGATEAAIFLDSALAGWDPRYSKERLSRACDLAIERDVAVTLTTWPLPQRRQIDAMLDDMAEMLPLGCVAWEVELEGLWRSKNLGGFPSMAAAGDYLLEQMRILCDPLDVRLEATSHLGHKESGHKAMVTGRVHRANFQFYSTRKDWQKTYVPWLGNLGPGARQRSGVVRVSRIPGVLDGMPIVGLGLAAYDQKWPGHTVAEAMDLALATLVRDASEAGWSVETVWLWSSKWLIGVLRDRQFQDEVRSWVQSRFSQPPPPPPPSP